MKKENKRLKRQQYFNKKLKKLLLRLKIKQKVKRKTN